MGVSVICISHSEGAQGQAIGRLVADRLGFRYSDDGIIETVARAEGIFPESVAQAERRDAGRSLEVDFGRVERTERLRDLIRAAILQAADEGRIVLVAHAASYALADRDDVLRVLVTASAQTRSERVAESEDIDPRKAAKKVAESDKGRTVYLQRFYSVKHEQQTDYDLVLNTDRLTTETAARAIAAIVTS